MSAQRLTKTLLTRRYPLPPLDADGDKEMRGRVLAIGGSRLVPGAILLAGVAALRAGAGKLQLATVRGSATPLAIAVPESIVVPLPESQSGEIVAAHAGAALRDHAPNADAILVGPGMATSRGVHAMVTALAKMLGDDSILVLDGAAAVALGAVPDALASLGGRAVLTPHAGEMASLLGIAKEEIERDRRGAACTAADRFGGTVALKGADTWIAAPDGTLLHYGGGDVGLGTSGSGDTLAGIVTGLAARGASATTAAAWGVWAHGAAGRVLTRRMGIVGFLARELLAEVPKLVG